MTDYVQQTRDGLWTPQDSSDTPWFGAGEPEDEPHTFRMVWRTPDTRGKRGHMTGDAPHEYIGQYYGESARELFQRVQTEEFHKSMSDGLRAMLEEAGVL